MLPENTRPSFILVKCKEKGNLFNKLISILITLSFRVCTITNTSLDTFQKAHTCSRARPASGQNHHVTTRPHLNKVLLLMVGLMWISMQMMHMTVVAHCTQQTTAQLGTNRRGGGQKCGEDAQIKTINFWVEKKI